MGTHFFRAEVHKPDGRTLNLYSSSRVPTWTEAPLLTRIEPPQPTKRWNPLRGEWVLYAPHRQSRTFLPPSEHNPLAPTQDPKFPTELPPGDYEIAVFENLFPAMVLGNEKELSHGACEVVVYTQNP